METKEYRLKQVTEKITKGTTPSNIGESFTEEGIMYFRSELIGKSKYIDKSDGLLFISNETHEKLKRSQIQKNDLLFSMAGIYLGKISLVGDEDFPANTNQAVAIIRFNSKEIDLEYVYYYMTQRWYNIYINSLTAQAAQPNINLEQIGNLKLNLPPLPTQQKIASILSAYDNLIQNYKKQIEALQTGTCELYKEWFVRFRFPGWQTTNFENGIPEGWKVERIGALYDSTSGGTPSREHEEYFQNGTYPWIKTGELKDSPILETEESISDEAIKHSSAKLFEKDSLIIAMYGATIGQLGINKMRATCNQACCVLRPKRDKAFGIYYLFHFFKENREFIIGLGNGAAQQNLSQVLINKLKIVNPNKEILEIFEKKESLFFEKIYHLQQQITNLTQQRDLLLPRLMSGKLEVR